MEAKELTIEPTPCCGRLPELEGPMLKALVACLGNEHRRLNYLTMQLALAATRLANSADATAAYQRAVEVWDEIRSDLWPHLQVEDGVVFSWATTHHAIPAALLDSLKAEREEMSKSVAALPEPSPGADSEPQTSMDRGALAQKLLDLARTLDSHVERYDGEVLPSILRALFHP